MNRVDQDRVLAPQWGWFRRIWMVVTIGLFGLLVALTILGVGPGGRRCHLADCGPVAAPVPMPPAVLDTRAPELTLAGENPVFLKRGEAYVESGVSALDDTDGEIPVGSSGNVDSATPGRYTLTYTATDRAGNSGILTRQVIVEDGGASPVLAVPAAVPRLPHATLYFSLGGAEAPDNALTMLKPLTDYLAIEPDATVVISGFHDASGRAQVNEALALSRAQTVRDLLIAQGVDAGRIELEKPQQTEGSGPAEEARRVEARVRQ